MQIQMPHGTGIGVPLVASPLRLSATPPEYASPPPLLGQHTDEVLSRLAGVGIEALAALRARGVV
jgi:crotonobetainyl-CoA:carnitine CoA-transferase CaiB-like acyl-CoA transferase